MQNFTSIIRAGDGSKQVVSPGNQPSFFKPLIQPKLTINQPNDIYEQEADAVADKVMRMPDGKNNEQSFFRPVIASIQRKCAECEEEEKKMQRKESSTEAPVNSSTEDYLNSLSGGRALSKNEKSFFEPRMGHDFSSVKIHNDPGAAKSAQSINALAYTTGNNIVFGEGWYAPDTDSGKRLMAHELTHVIQQGASGRVPSFTGDYLDTGVKIDSISKNASIPSVQRQAQPASCCCCVTSISIGNITKIDNAARMGHSFQTSMSLSYGAAPADRPMPLLDSCGLEWWEKTDVPYAAGTTAGDWADMTQNASTSGSFTAWAAKTEPCPGTEVVMDTDPPSLGKRPGRTVIRTLEFRIRVNSSGQCGCADNFVETTATQVLSMVNGAPVWASSSFTTP